MTDDRMQQETATEAVERMNTDPELVALDVHRAAADLNRAIQRAAALRLVVNVRVDEHHSMARPPLPMVSVSVLKQLGFERR